MFITIYYIFYFIHLEMEKHSEADLLASKEGEDDDNNDETIDVATQSRLLEEDEPHLDNTVPGAAATVKRTLAASLESLSERRPPASSSAERHRALSTGSLSSLASKSEQPGPSGANKALYQATSSAKNAAMAPRVLGGQSTLRASNYGSLVVDTDNRHQLTHSRELFSMKINISTSFNPQTMACNNCTDEPHNILYQGGGGGNRLRCALF